MSELNASNLRKEQGNEGPDLVGVTELTSPYFMVPPSGTTAERPQNPQKGTLRFNTDIGSLEYFKGDTLGWEQIQRTTPNLGGGTGSNAGVGARGLIALRYLPSTSNEINYLTISTLGNVQDFGDLTGARKWGGTAASRTRGIWAGGAPSQVTMDYVTIASTGNAVDFGDRTQASTEIDGLSNETRGVFAGGYATPANRNTMDYITIASTGNARDFGDLTSPRGSQGQGGGASTTRGLWAGGQRTPADANIIDYITIATTGNATDFGDMIRTSPNGYASASSPIKMYCMGGADADIGFITIATLGNETDFGGDMYTKSYMGGCGSSTRGVAFGGGPALEDKMEYIDYATAGNAKDFGDLGTSSSGNKGLSNAHGGL